jgi:putative FmdB family regulatory protein
MPIYEYECDLDNGGCGFRFDELQSINEEPKQLCPKCNKLTLKKLFGTPGLIFKGTGFYKTDYKDKEIK